jgi:hypothetical protein
MLTAVTCETRTVTGNLRKSRRNSPLTKRANARPVVWDPVLLSGFALACAAVNRFEAFNAGRPKTILGPNLGPNRVKSGETTEVGEQLSR